MKTGQVWVTYNGNCWAVEQILNDGSVMVRRVAEIAENGELIKANPEIRPGVYPWSVGNSGLLTESVANLAMVAA